MVARRGIPEVREGTLEFQGILEVLEKLRGDSLVQRYTYEAIIGVNSLEVGVYNSVSHYPWPYISMRHTASIEQPATDISLRIARKNDVLTRE